MAPTKAPKKAAKKAAAKKAHHSAGNDARRTFEHTGRVQAIASLALKEQDALTLLASAADAAFQKEIYKASANLLRAAEHLAFACVVDQTDRPVKISSDLVAAIQEEFRHLRDRARDHGEAKQAPESIRTIYVRMAREAESALAEGSYRKALEFARGSEALTHVEHLEGKLLGAPASHQRLRAGH